MEKGIISKNLKKKLKLIFKRKISLRMKLSDRSWNDQLKWKNL